MWGNSPELTQAAFESGKRPTEQWMNQDAERLMKILCGTKPFPGWNERLNGPGMYILYCRFIILTTNCILKADYAEILR